MVKQNPNVADLTLSREEKKFVLSVGDEVLEALSPTRQREIERLKEEISGVERWGTRCSWATAGKCWTDWTGRSIWW